MLDQIQHGREYCINRKVYLWYVYECKRSYSSKIVEILGEKIERNVYVNQQNFVPDKQLLIRNSFHFSFLHELLMIYYKIIYLVTALRTPRIRAVCLAMNASVNRTPLSSRSSLPWIREPSRSSIVWEARSKMNTLNASSNCTTLKRALINSVGLSPGPS